MAPSQCGLYGTPTPWDPSQLWRFTRKLSTVCDSVVSAITKEVLINDPNVASFVRSTYESLMPLQRQLVLQRLLERVPIHHDNLRVLDQMLQISQSKNSELRYRALMSCQSIAEQAINNFKAQRQNMHPTTAKLVAQDLGLA
ncbi:unnamed protein product [Schistocephalus solidus]|uniref:Leuk-A4-hydro_C domain-containing protein n=1 Tax=Schistocephalus solidus TaxID=70667 RepID=A0A183TPS8_SCHSO|nr:unnamed protein product [Schistocephalus solidus]